jgi:hypothetical protein
MAFAKACSVCLPEENSKQACCTTVLCLTKRYFLEETVFQESYIFWVWVWIGRE